MNMFKTVSCLSLCVSALIAVSSDAATIDVVSAWGLQTGAGAAAANTAAVAAHVSEVANGTELQFPAGDYYFSDTFNLSSVTASGVTLSASGASVLHSGITLGGASGVTVNGLSFNGCAGPAIVASGTDGLVVTNCTFTDVVGLYADGKKYNFAAVNVTGLNVIDSTYSFSDEHLDGQAYIDGGTQEKFSEAYANAVVIKCTADTTWATATNGLGLTAAAFNGKQLRKIGIPTSGSGKLVPDGTQAAIGINGIEVLQGCYYVAGNGHCGNGYIRVHSGAHLQIDGGGSTRISSRWVYLSGSGGSINSSTCTVRFMGTAYWAKSKDIRWVLEDDASIYIESGSNGVFYQGQVRLNGHTLTISRNNSDASCNMSNASTWYGPGTVIVDKVKLSSDNGGYSIASGSAPKFMFKNGAIFAPADATACNIVNDVDFATGTQIAPSTSTALTFDNMIGIPTISANVSSLTINNLYTARAVDVLAGRYPTMSGSLVFGQNAKWAVDNIGSLSREEYTLWSAAGGVSGSVKRSAGDEYRGWRSSLTGTTFAIDGRRLGTVIKFH